MAADVIREARNLLMEDGWCQGEYRNERGEHCLTDALMTAGTKLNQPWTQAFYAVYDVVGGVLCFNDTEGRTIHEVLDVLDKAEKIAETKEISNAR